MTRIPRVTAKIFAGKAQEDDLGQFGSALTGTKITNNDISVLQELPAYEEGWRSAVISNRNYPTLQEMNSVQRINSQQVAYTLQNGMPEWDEGTTYYTSQFCRVGTDFYFSKLDNNLGNNPTLSPDEWELWSGGGGTGGSSRNIGELVYSLLPQTDAGLHLLDGTLINGIGSYRAFVSYLANLYGDGTNIPAYFTTEEEWQQSVTNYGVCGKFVFNQEAYTVRLPKVTGLIEGTLDANALGNLIEAGLPALDLAIQSAGAHTHTRGTMNITGKLDGNSGNPAYRNGSRSASGAITTITANVSNSASGANSGTNLVGFNFDASRAWTGATSSNGAHTHAIIGSSIIGKTNTVQPQAINGYIYMVIANAVKTELEVDIDNITNDLTLKAETDLSNLTPAGEKHFINYTQVTNCIKEVPQRIKYTLVDGTLTILKGSVCIVPYGTEDLTATHPVGSTFINDNFKVVDTQYALDPQDNISKFFVWVEVQNDISQNSTVGDTTVAERFIALNISGEISDSLIWNANSYSGDTAPTSGSWQWYQLTNNKVVHTVSGATIDNSCLSFPILKSTSKNGIVFNSINKVFNGMGYIGSTQWVDKGLKALFPNGSNPDGTVNNIDWTNPGLFTYTFPDTQTHPFNLYLKLQEPTPNSPLAEIRFWIHDEVYESTQEPVTPADDIYSAWYNPETKIWKETYDGGAWVQEYLSPMGSNILTNGVISNATYKRPFVAADVQDIGFHWTYINKEIARDVNILKEAVRYDISNLLPNDGHHYEVFIYTTSDTGSAAGNYINIYVGSDMTNGKAGTVSQARTRASAGVSAGGNIILEVGLGRFIFVNGNNSGVGTYRLTIGGYRRIGTNI